VPGPRSGWDGLSISYARDQDLEEGLRAHFSVFAVRCGNGLDRARSNLHRAGARQNRFE